MSVYREMGNEIRDDIVLTSSLLLLSTYPPFSLLGRPGADSAMEGAAPSSAGVPVTRVRRFFPETWIWSPLRTDARRREEEKT